MAVDAIVFAAMWCRAITLFFPDFDTLVDGTHLSGRAISTANLPHALCC